MRRYIAIECKGQIKNIVCLSFQSDGSLTFAFTDDNTFSGSDLHATYHPITHHHVRERGKPPIFSALQDFSLMLEMECQVKWLSAVSNAFSKINSGKAQGYQSSSQIWKLLSDDENVSLSVKVDLLKPPINELLASSSTRFVGYEDWRGICFRIDASLVPATVAELTIQHSY